MNYTNDFKVRINCMTYNHAPYIADTMSGFCMQKTDFPYVAIIVDDASTDGEQGVINNYIHEHFDLEEKSVARNEETDDYALIFARHKENKNCFFAVFLLKYNHYSLKKAKWPYYLEFAKVPKFIAICEGDDYWTDPYKLQKQVDYLDSHPECGMVYTQAKQYFQETGEYIEGWADQTDFEDLLQSANKIMTLTSCYRWDVVSDYAIEIGSHPEWLMGDFPLWLYISKHSKIHFMDDVTGVYRILKNSASHNSDVYKLADFLVSTYHVRCYFAKKYGREELLDVLASNEADNLLRLSVQKDKNISPFILRFAKERGVVTWRLIIKCIMYSTRLGRSYHRRKYFVR